MLALVSIRAGSKVGVGEVQRHLEGHLLGPVRIVIVGTSTDDRGSLRALNTDRDVLFRSLRALVFVCSSGEEARILRREAPDLTASLDVSADLDEAVVLEGEELRCRLSAEQVRRYASLDLSGLVPHSTEVVRVPMDRVYQEREFAPRSGQSNDDGVVLLLAEPGAGKTLWMKHKAVSCRDRVSLYVALAGWAAQAREQSVSLGDFVQAEVGRLLGLPPVDLTASFLSIELLLDGLDEVPSLGDRRRIVDEALALRAQHPAMKVVIAAREHVVDDLLSDALRKLRVERLAPLSLKQGQELVVRLLRSRREIDVDTDLSDEVVALRDGIVHHPDFVRFVGNPLLLTFVTVLAELGRSMPSQRVELYGDLLEMLIVSWQRVRSSSTGRRLNRADVLRVVAPLGWRLVERGVGGLTETELLDFLVELDTREGDARSAREAARHRLDQLREDSALLHATDGLWRFHHATIAEYLAARAALISPELRQVLEDDPYEPRRVQVLAFTLAIACDVDPRDEVALPLLSSLDRKASRRGRYDARIPRTLVACLTEARSMPAGVRQRLAAHVLRIALRQQLREDRRFDAVMAVTDLCHLSDRPVQAALEEIVASEGGVDARALASAMNGVLGFFFPLPVSIQLAGVDATPLVQRWIESREPSVRAMAWAAWARPGDWGTLVTALDPDAASSVLSGLEVIEVRAHPPSWTEAIRSRFPELPLDPPYNAGTSSTNNPTP